MCSTPGPGSMRASSTVFFALVEPSRVIAVSTCAYFGITFTHQIYPPVMGLGSDGTPPPHAPRPILTPRWLAHRGPPFCYNLEYLIVTLCKQWLVLLCSLTNHWMPCPPATAGILWSENGKIITTNLF